MEICHAIRHWQNKTSFFSGHEIHQDKVHITSWHVGVGKDDSAGANWQLSLSKGNSVSMTQQGQLSKYDSAGATWRG